MTNFVILGQGRTGSKLLVQQLKSHPDIYCEGEILRRGRWPIYQYPFWLLWHFFPLPYLQYRSQRMKRASGALVYGFKLFPGHLQFPELAIQELSRIGWQIIHLQRRSLFDLTMSTMVARTTGRHGRREGEFRPSIQLDLNIEQFLLLAHQRTAEFQLNQRLLLSIPHLDVIYEDHLQHATGRSALAPRLLSYLTVREEELVFRTAKQWVQPYEEIVTNYSELWGAFQQSGLPIDLVSGNVQHSR